MLGLETVEKYVEKQVIEIAPLAFMRGRTLNDAVVILDGKLKMRLVHK